MKQGPRAYHSCFTECVEFEQGNFFLGSFFCWQFHAASGIVKTKARISGEDGIIACGTERCLWYLISLDSSHLQERGSQRAKWRGNYEGS